MQRLNHWLVIIYILLFKTNIGELKSAYLSSKESEFDAQYLRSVSQGLQL